jgi:protein-tyrosine phosphatase
MDQIRPWLYIGRYRDTLNKSYLDHKSIRAMLLLAEKVEQQGIVSLYLPVEDVAPISKEHIRQGVEFVREHKSQGNRVLIACGAGMNRSSAFSAAVLKEEEGLNLFQSFRIVKDCHPESMPHQPVWDSLCKYYGEDVPYLDIMRLGISKG